MSLVGRWAHRCITDRDEHNIELTHCFFFLMFLFVFIGEAERERERMPFHQLPPSPYMSVTVRSEAKRRALTPDLPHGLQEHQPLEPSQLPPEAFTSRRLESEVGARK